MKKDALHPDSKPPVHKVQHSDTYKVSQYGSEKMNVLLASERSERDTLRSVQSRIAIYILEKWFPFVRERAHS